MTIAEAPPPTRRGPGLCDVRRAADVVHATLDPTPLVGYPLLDAAAGGTVLVKREDVLPTGAFKVRGGVHLAATLTDDERRAGLVTASTGNHAQSVAWAARTAGVPAVVVMPTSAPQCKQEAVEALGAHVVRRGETLSEAAAHARSLPRAFVDPTDPRIVLGHATAYLELFEALARSGQVPDVVAVPIGSGTGAVGACVVRDALAPSCRVLGVQAAAAPAARRSWRSGRPEQAPCSTRASGLATSASYESTQVLLRARLDDFVLVTDYEIDAAARLLLLRAHVLAEGAGAASLAGLLADPRRRPGGVSVAVCTGANASDEDVARLLALPG